jgi:redox-sensitive bicupin YhaK (pirin superfamily)
MKTILHTSESRGIVNQGWLQARHSFSFANYYNQERIHFGVLRVLNDDIFGAGGGFGMHPHDNMEIITIPFEGALRHGDNMGNGGVIQRGDVQVMSAGTGIVHSEINDSKEEAVKLFQIWLFPNKRDVTPRYDQKSFDVKERQNKFQLLVSPDAAQGSLWIHQDAWFWMGSFDSVQKVNYSLQKKNNGVYLVLVEGEIMVNGVQMRRRDAIGITEIESFDIEILQEGTEILIMDIPMQV